MDKPDGENNTTRPIEIIISLQEQPYQKVISGVKTYEFRRRWPLRSAIAYVYRSGKKRELCAAIELSEPIRGSPSDLAIIAESMDPGSGASIEKYLTPSNGGFAVPIKRVVEFAPISLAELRTLRVHPPQFFTYLQKHPKLRTLLRQKLQKNESEGRPSVDL